VGANITVDNVLSADEEGPRDSFLKVQRPSLPFIDDSESTTTVTTFGMAPIEENSKKAQQLKQRQQKGQEGIEKAKERRLKKEQELREQAERKAREEALRERKKIKQREQAKEKVRETLAVQSKMATGSITHAAAGASLSFGQKKIEIEEVKNSTSAKKTGSRKLDSSLRQRPTNSQSVLADKSKQQYEQKPPHVLKLASEQTSADLENSDNPFEQ
jgi:hypothetical protein